jgi:hypothetical protein
MPTVKVDLSNISAASATHERSASYSAGTGNPSWVTVGSTGDVDLSHPPQANLAVDLEFSLPTGYTFATTSPFTTNPASADFSVVWGAGTSTLTVSDSNNDAAVGTQYDYTLHLSDGTFIDPKVINY